MRRILLLSTIALLAAFFIAATPAQAASCSNNYPNDGHPGPWRTTTNGGTLHGNTLHIDCPTSSTHWDVVYRVQANTGGPWINVWSDERTGNGTPADFSEKLSPYSCDTTSLYRTHVDNVVTGGTINKPAGGGGVHLTCGALASAKPRDATATAAACTHNSSAPQLGGGIQTTQSGWCNVTWHVTVFLQVEIAGSWSSASFDDGSQALWTSLIFQPSTQHSLNHTFTGIHQTPYCAYNWRSRTNFWQGANPPYTNIGTEISPALHKTC